MSVEPPCHLSVAFQCMCLQQKTYEKVSNSIKIQSIHIPQQMYDEFLGIFESLPHPSSRIISFPSVSTIYSLQHEENSHMYLHLASTQYKILPSDKSVIWVSSIIL
jgi:hypothetical protein